MPNVLNEASYKESLIEKQRSKIRSQKGQINQQVKIIGKRDKQISSSKEQIEIQGNEIKIRDYKIAALEADLKRQYKKIDDMETQITTRDEQIERQANIIVERDEEIYRLLHLIGDDKTAFKRDNTDEDHLLEDESFLISRINDNEPFDISFGKHIEFSRKYSKYLTFSCSIEGNSVSIHNPTEKSVIALFNTKRHEIKYFITENEWIIPFSEKYIKYDTSWVDESCIERMVAAYRNGTWEEERKKIRAERLVEKKHTSKSDLDECEDNNIKQLTKLISELTAKNRDLSIELNTKNIHVTELEKELHQHNTLRDCLLGNDIRKHFKPIIIDNPANSVFIRFYND